MPAAVLLAAFAALGFSCRQGEVTLTPAEEVAMQGDLAYSRQNFEEAAERYQNALQIGTGTVRLHNNWQNILKKNKYPIVITLVTHIFNYSCVLHLILFN